MKRALNHRGIDTRIWMVFLLAGALASIACNNDVNVTGPEFPSFTPQWQTFKISGTLTAEQGLCRKATILYDGRELAGARVVCDIPGGCDQLELQSGSIMATPGAHTIAFRVLRQSESVVEYMAVGEVVGEMGPTDPISLGPTREQLEAGQSITFEFDHLP